MNDNDYCTCIYVCACVAVHSTTMDLIMLMLCRMNCSLHSTIRRFTTDSDTTLHLPQLSDLQTQTQRLISMTVKESCLHFAAARPTGVVFPRIGNLSSMDCGLIRANTTDNTLQDVQYGYL